MSTDEVVFMCHARPNSNKTKIRPCSVCKVLICYLPSQSSGKYCSRKCKSKAYYKKDNLIRRFWSHVTKKSQNQCWLWNCPVDKYGQFTINHKNKAAHRFFNRD